MLRLWLIVGGFFLAGCASQPPLEGVRAFSNASDAFNAASQPLLDQASVAERERARKLIETPPADAKNVLDVPQGIGTQRRLLLDLPVDQVLALATVGDPPATANYRKGVAAIKHYATVLVLLAEGQNIEAARAELGLFASNIAGVATLIPGGAAAPAMLGSIMVALQPLIDNAARAQNAAELRSLVVKAAPIIAELNASLRAGAQPLFYILVARERQVIINGGDAAAAIERIDAFRVAVANWLVLLDLVGQASGQLAAMVVAEPDASTLAGLTELSTRITNYAEGARRTLAVIRAGQQP
jgi:hypothetical protein